MSRHMKYVVHEGPLAAEIYLFPNFISHDDFVARMNFDLVDIVSAGFVTADLECYGRSVSLNLESRNEDTRILGRTFGKEYD
jgi:hypothetical protein